MKIYRFLYQAIMLVVVICFLGCSSRNKDEIKSDIVHFPVTADRNNDKERMPRIEFEQTRHDFGKLIQGEKVSYTFKFKNTGNAALVLSAVVPSCGCTAARQSPSISIPKQKRELYTIALLFRQIPIRLKQGWN